ncbi:MAG: hypothetical protein WD049_05585 [Candidatus Paceibacterota bacterium]
MFSFFSKTDKQTHLLIECGGASAACAFLVTDADKKPKIVYQKRVIFDTHETPDHRATQAMLTTTLAKLLAEARSAGHAKLEALQAPKRLTSTTVTFTAPWYVASTTHIDQHYEDDRLITESYLADLQTQEKDTLPAFPAEFQDAQPVIIDTAILQTKLNGYITTNPTEKSTRNFEAQLYTGAVPQSVFDAVETTIGNVFDISHVTYHTLPLVTHAALSDLFASLSSAVLIDISGTHTTLTTVYDGTIRDVISFAIGTHHLVRHTATELNIGMKAAASALALHDLSRLDTASHETVRDLIAKHTNDWFEEYKKHREQIRKNHPLGSRAIIIATGGMTEYFFTALKKRSEEESTEGVQLIQLTNEHLSKRLRFPESPPPDPFIALEAIVLADNDL